ncbi:MAG: hypothetical protein KatS3mg033_0717 [Thermonema sp.]|nr:MAG: hypothetical protein KatS3mg033_0717 [Thermonema sp.]
MVRVLRQMVYGFVFLIVAGVAARAQIVEREWLQIFANAAGDEVIYDVAFTASGDIIAVGKKAVSGAGTDILVRKLSGTDGSLVREYIATGSSSDYATAVAIAPDGSILVVGTTSGGADFGGGSSTDAGGFILKLNADLSYGNVKIIKPVPGGTVELNDIQLTSSGFYVGGISLNNNHFDWNGSTPLTPTTTGTLAFVAKGQLSDMSYQGHIIIADPGTGNVVYLRTLSTDNAGNVYAAGYFNGSSVSFGGITLSSALLGGSSGWVAKIDFSATPYVAWVGSFGGDISSGNTGGYGYALAWDAFRNILWLGGRVAGSNIDIDPGTGQTNITASYEAGVLLPLDPSSGALDTSIPYYGLDRNDGGAPDSEFITNITIGANGEIYVAGYYHDANPDFDPSSTDFYNPYPTDSDGAFLAEIYEDGNSLRMLYARCFIGGDNYAWTLALAQQNDKVVFAGGFYSTVDFDPTLSGTYNHTSASGADAFVYLQKPLARYDFTISDGITANPIAGAEVNIETETVTTSASGVATFALPAGTFNYVVSGPASSSYIPYFSALTVSAVSNAPNYEAITLCPLETPSFEIYVVSPNVVAEVEIYASSPSCDYTATEYEVELSETLDFAAVQTIVAPNNPAADPTIASLSPLSLLPKKQYYVRVKAKNTAEGKESNYAPPRAFVYTEKPTATEPARFVRIFPVPAHDYLQIELLRPAQQLRVYDITGREWASRKSWSATPLTIDMQPLPQGVYFVEVIFEDLPPLVQKVVKW